MRYAGLNVLLCLVLTVTVYGDTIAVWNFNDAFSDTSGGGNGFLVDYGNGIMSSDFNPSNIGNTSGSALNSFDDDPAGLALRLSSSANNGRNLTWKVSTEGFDSIGLSFAVQGTGTGFSHNQFLYSVNSGASWNNFGAPFDPPTSFAIHNFDLSSVLKLNENPNAAFRILFEGASSGSGNNKIDNLIVSGSPAVPPISTPVPESSTIALTAAGLTFVFLARKGKRQSKKKELQSPANL